MSVKIIEFSELNSLNEFSELDKKEKLVMFIQNITGEVMPELKALPIEQLESIHSKLMLSIKL